MNRILLFPALALLGGCPPSEDDSAVDPDSLDLCESGEICTWIGTGDAGLPMKEGCRAEQPSYLPVDMSIGPTGNLFYLDWNNHQILEVVPGNGGTGEGCDHLSVVTGTTLLGDGPEGPALDAAWNHPSNITFRPSDGALVFAAWHNSRVVSVDFATGLADWFVGTGKRNYAGDGAAADLADLDLPVGVEYDSAGNLYIADQANQRIRKVSAADGTITTVVGTGVYGYNGDEIPAAEAQLFNELSQAAAPAGKISIYDDSHMYIADTSNHRVRVVTMSDWIIHTAAGTGTLGYSGDGGPASAAQVNGPRDVDVGPDGSVYIADTGNNCIRVITPDGNIDTFAGVCGEAGYAGDGGAPTEALLYQPFGVEVDHETGAVYIADTYSNVIRKVTP